MQEAIGECVQALLDDPARPSLQVHRVQGTPDIWEAYVTMGDRITFKREGALLKFVMHCNHNILDPRRLRRS